MGGFIITGDHVSRHGAVTSHDLSAPPRYPVDIGYPPTSHVSPQERWFLDLYHAIGPIGVLVLKSLAYLTAEGRGADVQVSRETLARHCDRSIRTVSRAIARLKACHLTAAAQPPPQGFDCWTPNVYRLTPLGLHVATLLGTGSSCIAPPARDVPGAPVLSRSNNTVSEGKTSRPAMAHAEKSGVCAPPAREPARGEASGQALSEAEPPALTCLSPPAMPQLGPDLVPLVRALAEAEPLRFAHLPDWLQAKLRAGVSRRHLCTALAELTAHRDSVRSWAGWLQQCIEELSKAEGESERARIRTLTCIAGWKQQWTAWERERVAQGPGGASLVALVALVRGRERAAGREECGSEV